MDENNPMDKYIGRLEKSLKSISAVAKSRFKSWKENPFYLNQLAESFEVMRDNAYSMSPDELRMLCQITLETRLLFVYLIEAYKKGDFYGAILTGYGQEAIGAGVGLAMGPEDWIARDHRNVSLAIARGIPADAFFLNHFMRSTGPTGGYDPNVHFCDLEHRDLGFQASDMAMSAGLINGAISVKNMEKAHAMGSELTGAERIAGVGVFGDGARSTGIAFASLNFAKARGLPILEVIHDNEVSLGTSGKEQHGGIDLSNTALGFEMPGITVDGDDALEVYLASQWLLHFARHASHPALLHAKTFRRHGHNESEDPRYLKEIFDPEYYQKMMSDEADPVARIAKVCETFELFSGESDFIKIRDGISSKLESAYKKALAAPEPESDRDNLRSVFTDPECKVSGKLARAHPGGLETKKLTIRQAIQEALFEEFEKDPMLYMLGEDIGFPKGGVFAVTHPLLERFGDRIVNSTLDEAALLSFAVGWAMASGRPIINELQFLNFGFAGIHPLVTLAATRAFMMNTSVPMTVRGPAGYAPSSNHYHESLRFVSAIALSLGVKIIFASNPKDAKGLLKSAINDPDPCLFVEEMSGYSVEGNVPQEEHYTPIGVAEVVQEGGDVTIVAWGPKMMGLAAKCAVELARTEDIEAEVIDLRTLVPWDKETVFNSVKKTGRIIILEEDCEFLGFGAEISASISQDLTFYSLSARIRRVAAMNTPIPGNRKLEDARLPQAADVVQAARELMEES